MSTGILEKPSETQPSAPNPFPGLRPFTFEENDLFFGRDGQSKKLLSILSSKRFLAVVGTSGSGKSSLVRAGLLSELHGGRMRRAGPNWRIAYMRPGNDPIGNLTKSLNEPGVFDSGGGEDNEEGLEYQRIITESTLRRGSPGLVEAVRQLGSLNGDNLLLIVDQFEELFRVAKSSPNGNYENEAAAFVKLLLAAKGQKEVPIYIVITMRSDFLGDCAQFWDLPEAINEGQYLIPRMTREERRKAITGPIIVSGASIAPQLVTQLVNETQDKPDHLPILQHALMRTWNKVQQPDADFTLDVSHYESVGGMSEALSRHADEAFEGLDKRQQQIAEKMFKSLTEKGDNDREVRRPTQLSEICAVAGATETEVVKVVNAFREQGKSFLMPPPDVPLTGETLIDISHESLIGGWQRLKTWVDEEARSARVYRRLADTANLHKSRQAGLLDDVDVQIALDWRDASKPDQAWAKRYDDHFDFNSTMGFLKTCKEARDKEARRRKAELTRTRIFAVVLLILLGLCVGLFISERTAKLEVEKQKQNNTRTRYVMGMSNMQKALIDKNCAGVNEQLGNVYSLFPAAQKDFELSYLWGLCHDELRTLQAQHTSHVTAVAFSKNTPGTSNDGAPRNGLLATADRGGNINVWDVSGPTKDWNLKKELKTNAGGVSSMTFSSDSRILIIGTSDGYVKLWETNNWTELQPLNVPPTVDSKSPMNIASVAFSSDSRGGGFLAAGIANGTVKLWRKSGDGWGTPTILPVAAETVTVWAVAFSTDGKTLAAGSHDGKVKLWNTSTWQNYKTLESNSGKALGGKPNSVLSLAFSNNGKLLATGNSDGTVNLWETGSFVKRSQLVRHLDAVLSITFIRDELIVTGSADGSVKVWDAVNGKEREMRKGHAGEVLSIALSPDNKTIVTGSADKYVKLWATNGGSREAWKNFPGTNTVISSVAFSTDGELLTGSRAGGEKSAESQDQGLKLWDASLQESGTGINERSGQVNSVSLSRNEAMLAIGNADGTVKVSQKTGEVWEDLKTHRIAPENVAVWAVAFSTNKQTNQLLATACNDGTVKLWETNPWREHKTLKSSSNQGGSPGGANSVYSLAFSPDGKLLASGNSEGRVSLWETGTWREFETPQKEHNGPVLTVAFSPDSTRLATGGGDWKAVLWDTQKWQVVNRFLGHSDAVSSVAFSADGQRLITGSYDGYVKLWVADPQLVETLSNMYGLIKRQELMTLAKYQYGVYSVAISPDGTRVAVGSADPNKTLHLIRAATPFEIESQLPTPSQASLQ